MKQTLLTLVLAVGLCVFMIAQSSLYPSGNTNAPQFLKVFPNPANDSFSITETDLIDHIVLYNIIGKKVRTFEYLDDSKYDISNLPDGMYFVSMRNSTDGILKTVRLNKRFIRP